MHSSFLNLFLQRLSCLQQFSVVSMVLFLCFWHVYFIFVLFSLWIKNFQWFFLVMLSAHCIKSLLRMPIYSGILLFLTLSILLPTLFDLKGLVGSPLLQQSMFHPRTRVLLLLFIRMIQNWFRFQPCLFQWGLFCSLWFRSLSLMTYWWSCLHPLCHKNMLVHSPSLLLLPILVLPTQVRHLFRHYLFPQWL